MAIILQRTGNALAAYIQRVDWWSLVIALAVGSIYIVLMSRTKVQLNTVPTNPSYYTTTVPTSHTAGTSTSNTPQPEATPAPTIGDDTDTPIIPAPTATSANDTDTSTPNSTTVNGVRVVTKNPPSTAPAVPLTVNSTPTE